MKIYQNLLVLFIVAFALAFLYSVDKREVKLVKDQDGGEYDTYEEIASRESLCILKI